MNGLEQTLVSVVIVVVDSNLMFFENCVNSVLEQSHTHIECLVVDNCYEKQLSMPNDNRIKRIVNRQRSWYCRNNNLAVSSALGNYVLLLNTDAILDRRCIAELIAALEARPHVGSATPKLYRLGDDGTKSSKRIIDTAGLYWTQDQRHHDRGSGQEDNAQYSNLEYVFGASGAAAFYRKSAIDAVKLGDQYLDEDFVHGREDADIAWRLQLNGWECLFVPSAIGYHKRTIRPNSRKTLSPWLNCQQVRNRFLLRINNMTLSVFLRFFPFILMRDLLVVIYAFLFERESISAFHYLWGQRERLLSKREKIMGMTCVRSRDIAFWFRHASVGVNSHKDASVVRRKFLDL